MIHDQPLSKSRATTAPVRPYPLQAAGMSRRCPPCNDAANHSGCSASTVHAAATNAIAEQQRGRDDAWKRGAERGAEPIHQRSPRGRNSHAREQRHRRLPPRETRVGIPPSRQEAPLARDRGTTSRAVIARPPAPRWSARPRCRRMPSTHSCSATRPRSAASRTSSGTIQFSASPAKGSTRKGTGTSPPTNKVTTRPATSAHSSASAKPAAQSKLVPSQHVHGSHQQGPKHERQEVQLIAQEHHESPDSPCDLDQHQASESQRNRCVNAQHLRQRHRQSVCGPTGCVR